MKTQLFVLFCTLFLSVDAFGQNPTWISNRGSLNQIVHEYSYDGYNEEAYLWQDAFLKGAVQACTISEKNHYTTLGIVSYNMEFKYNTKKQLEQLFINGVSINPKSPKVVKNIRKESLTWVLDQLQTRAYWLDDKCVYLVNYIYNDAGQIKSEQWCSISQGYQQIYVFPLEVLYDYKKDGAYTVTGSFKEDFDSEKGIKKYLLEFNEKGQLVKRTLYNRELKRRQENIASKLETFVYTYNEEGYLTSMTSTNGNAAPNIHCYKYIKEDNFGNWQIQQVYDDKKVLLFEMERVIEYR